MVVSAIDTVKLLQLLMSCDGEYVGNWCFMFHIPRDHPAKVMTTVNGRSTVVDDKIGCSCSIDAGTI
jgi:hypothetical protein